MNSEKSFRGHNTHALYVVQLLHAMKFLSDRYYSNIQLYVHS